MNNALHIEEIEISALTPYAANAKRHDQDQVKKIADSIADFGFNSPVLVDATGGIIAGHGRVMAAEHLGLQSVPCIRLGHLSETQKRAYIIADNRLAELGGGWDTEMLKAELADLAALGVDLDEIGFEAGSLDNLTSGLVPHKSEDDDEKDSEEVELTEEQAAIVDECFREWAVEMLDYLKAVRPLGFLSPNSTRAVARVLFLRSLFLGKSFPRYGLSGYQPHQFDVAGHNMSMAELMQKVASGRVTPNCLSWATQGKPSLDHLLKTGMPVHSARLPLDFPADLATSLINEFTPEGGAVLDPCHGWGGRMVGFLLSRAGSYTGFDPSPETAAGVRAASADFLRYVKGKRVQTFEECFEESSLDPDSYDFAMTSPPYFDVEKYTGPKQAHRSFKKFDLWDVGFYREMIVKVADALKAGGVFALQVGNQKYPLEERARHHAKDAGLEYVETRASGMVNNRTQTPDEDGEVIVIFRKP